MENKFVYGVVTAESKDAAEAASYFGDYQHCSQKLVGEMLPHYHPIFNHDIHFWYGG